MAALSLDQVQELSNRFYTEAGPVEQVSRLYGRGEIVEFLQSNIRAIRREVEGMSARQLAYRLPGTPAGPDESGDEEHFDTSQIMTHLAAAMGFHWWNMTRAMRHERPPMPKAPEGATVTGKKKNVMGGGGWQSSEATELCNLLDDTTEGFVAYVNQLPLDTGDARSSFGLFKDMTPHDWFFAVAVHSGAHLIQIREMKARPDFPES